MAGQLFTPITAVCEVVQSRASTRPKTLALSFILHHTVGRVRRSHPPYAPRPACRIGKGRSLTASCLHYGRILPTLEFCLVSPLASKLLICRVVRSCIFILSSVLFHTYCTYINKIESSHCIHYISIAVFGNLNIYQYPYFLI